MHPLFVTSVLLLFNGILGCSIVFIADYDRNRPVVPKVLLMLQYHGNNMFSASYFELQ
jgi:hypothetical protein